MHCPSCAHENREGRKFCVECGGRLELRCPSCDSPYEAGQKFCGECGAALAGPAAAAGSASPAAPAARKPPEGERRQLTVLFCDLVDSTALSTRLDPELLREQLRAYQSAAAEVIERYGGHIAQYLGDGLLVYFGYPQTHEDDAHRAIRAALGIVAATAQLRTPAGDSLGLAVRAGIHTGLVVVGEMGGGTRREQLALGEVPNIAARLQALAGPGAVIISDQTQRLTRGSFDTRALGRQQLKGLEQAAEVYQVLRPNRWRSRVDLAAEHGLSPFAGRGPELDTLLARFADARAGHTQVVFLHGEPGIGKSRLLYEFKRRLEGTDLTWLEGRCISYGQSIPYLPLIDLLKANFRIEEADTEAVIAAKLDRGVRAMGGDLLPALPYLKLLLAIDPADAAATLDPQVRKALTFEALRALAVAGAAIRPLVIVVEDVHWIDPLSEEWLSYLAETIQDRSLLLVITYRPDYDFRFGERPNFSHLSLQTLSAQESETISRGVLGAAELPEELQALIFRKAEGNPLFVEEVTKSLEESGAIRRAGTGYRLTRPLEAIAVPDTVQDVIMARLDRLPTEPRSAIQTASVIGREFTVRLLERTAELQGRMEEYLRELKAVELIYERSLYPELAYMFKHALTHDVAYNSLLLARRRVLHRVVGDAIEALYADRLAEHYETLAYHYERAEAWEKAIDYLLKSGEKALAAHAYPEALAYFQRGLRATGDGQDEKQEAALLWGLSRSQTGLDDLQSAVGTALRAFELYLADEDIAGAVAVAQFPWPPVPSLLTGVAELIERALTLVPEDSLDAARILISHATALYMTKGNYDAARRAFARAENLARKHDERSLQVRVLAAATSIDMFQTRLAEGAERGLRALELAQQEGDLLGMAASSWPASYCLYATGDLERAEQCIRAGIEPAERLRGRTHLARVYFLAAFVAWVRGDLGAARGFCRLGLASAPGDYRLLIALAITKGEAGNLGVARASVESLLRAWRAAGAVDVGMASNGATTGAIVALISRDVDLARACARVARQVLSAPDAPELYREMMRLALALTSVLEQDTAGACDSYLALRPRSGLNIYLLAVDHVLGLLATTIGDAQAAANHFEDALAFCRKGGYRRELGWTCLDYAELLLERAVPGGGDRARELLDEALAIARELGMRPLLERALRHKEVLKA